jgi:hypothetical protein
VKEDLIKRKLNTDFQRYVFKAIPQGFSSTDCIIKLINEKHN